MRSLSFPSPRFAVLAQHVARERRNQCRRRQRDESADRRLAKKLDDEVHVSIIGLRQNSRTLCKGAGAAEWIEE